MGKMKVTHRDFVVAYASSQTLEQVMSATDMTKAAIWGRVQYLRKKGVKFPKLNQQPLLGDLEIAQLNSLIKKHDVRKRGV